RRARRGAPRGARRARLLAPRAPLHAVLPLRGFPARRAAYAARRVGRQAESAPPAVAAFVAGAASTGTTEGGLREVRRQGRLARGAERVTRQDLERLTLTLGRWVAGQLTPRAAGDLAVRLHELLVGRPAAPMLASALEVARRHGWDQRAVTALAQALGEAL